VVGPARGGNNPTADLSANFFAFDLASVETYLVAERIERFVSHVQWLPVPTEALGRLRPGPRLAPLDADRRRAQRRARELHLPLLWPDRHPFPVSRAMRASLVAARYGRAAGFAVAIGRLAFAGSMDVEDDPETIAVAARAAQVPELETLAAADDSRLDDQLAGHALLLLAAGLQRLPALCLDSAVSIGEDCIAARLQRRRLDRSLG
jgi:2-hydroxychromene-2-carboxylate isomerase